LLGASAIEEGGDADPHQNALLAQLGLLGPQLPIIRHRFELFHQQRKITAVIGDLHRGLVGKLVGLDQIARAQLDDVDTEFARAVLDQPFDDEQTFGPACAAIGVDRRRVRIGTADAAMDRRDLVQLGKHRRVEKRWNTGPERAQIGTDIGNRIDLEAEYFAIVIERHAAGRGVVARMGIDNHVFDPRRDPLDRPADQTRCPEQRRFLGIVIDLLSETAADIGGDHANALLGDKERAFGEPLANHVRVLGRRPERVALVHHVVLPDNGARLHRYGGDAIVGECQRRDVVRLGESRGDRIAVAGLPVEHLVGAELFMHQRRAGIERRRCVCDRR